MVVGGSVVALLRVEGNETAEENQNSPVLISPVHVGSKRLSVMRHHTLLVTLVSQLHDVLQEVYNKLKEVRIIP